MAFAAVHTLSHPTGDYYVKRGRRRVKIIRFTKLIGDTVSGNVDTGLKYVHTITVLKATMAVDSGAAATTGQNTTGGNFTTSITAMATDYTDGYIVAEGSKM